MFHTQYNPDIFVAEHYVFRNTTTDWWSKDLVSVWETEECSCTVHSGLIAMQIPNIQACQKYK
jgi:hypothetical protein